MGDTSETNTKVLSRELFLGVVALKTPIQKNHYLRDMGPFPRYCHICEIFVGCAQTCLFVLFMNINVISGSVSEHLVMCHV